MSDSDLVKLYSGQILALAADIPHLGRLDAPTGTARKRSPLCGSSVTVDLVMTSGRVAGFAQDVKACALGQASAAIMGRVILGRSLEELLAARESLRNMLENNGPPPAAPFDGYAILTAARDYRNRHASILLALDAACDAADPAVTA